MRERRRCIYCGDPIAWPRNRTWTCLAHTDLPRLDLYGGYRPSTPPLPRPAPCTLNHSPDAPHAG